MSTSAPGQRAATSPAGEIMEEPEGLGGLLHLIAKAVPYALTVPTAVLSLLYDDKEVVAASEGAHESLADGSDFPVGALLAAAEKADPVPVLVIEGETEVESDTATALHALGMTAVLAAPVLSDGGQRLGLIVVADSSPRSWDQEQIEMLQKVAGITSNAVTSLRGAAMAQAELGRTGAWLRRSFDDGLAGHAVATATGKVLACNAEFARIAGFSTIEEALATDLHTLEAEPGEFMALLKRLRESPIIPLEEIRVVRRDGTPAQVLAKLVATIDENGYVTEIRVYLLDITQRHIQEEKLRQSDERFQLVELATQDVLWEWDLTTGRFEWNGAVARRFRYTPEEIRASIDWYEERIHPADRERVIRGLERAILGVESAWSDEYRFLRGDGTYAVLLDRGHVVRNGRSEPKRVVGWMLDITERKEAEEMQRFLAAASAALEGGALEVDVTAGNLARIVVPALADFCLVDLCQPEGGVRRVAVAHAVAEKAKLLNCGCVMMPDTNGGGTATLTVAVNGVPDFQSDCGEDSQQRSELSHRLGISEESGTRAYMSVPITAHGRILGATTFGVVDRPQCFGAVELLTAKDLVRRAGPALENSQHFESTRQAMSARDEVLGVVSHDLRVPLNTILAVLALLEDTTPERRTQVRHLHDMVKRATGQMEMLIADLLDTTRMQAERFTIERSPESAAALVAAACELMQPIAGAKEITLECEVQSDLPPIPLDGRQILRVLGNLVSNAIKFSPARTKIRVHGEVRGSELWISVRDSGEGIPQQQIDKVFDKFWTGRDSDRRGTGLGLAIAEGIVEAHGGRIWVESKEGAGSTFTFTLPVSTTPVADARSAAPQFTPPVDRNTLRPDEAQAP